MLDTLTPLLMLAAKSAAENAAKDAGVKETSSLPITLSTVSAVGTAVIPSACLAGAAIGMGLFPFFLGSSKAKSDEKQEDKTKDSNSKSPAVDDKLVEAVVERVKSELPALIETINNSPSQTIVSETYDAVYTSQ